MAEAALYILTGLTLYAGGHHLYLGTGRASVRGHLALGALYLLVAVFALSSGLTYDSATLDELLPTGKLDISLGLVLWAAIVWYVAFRTGYKPLILLDLITAAWGVFLVRNMISSTSLLYADVTPVRQTLLSGETVGYFYTRISPWWTAVEAAMLISLAFCLYACYRLYRGGRRTAALVTATGLGMLGLVTLHDHLVSAQLIRAAYLAPYGFVLFLLPASLYPLIRRWRAGRTGKTPPTVYNLPYMPDQASFHTDVAQLRTPLRPAGGGNGPQPCRENSRARPAADDDSVRQDKPQPHQAAEQTADSGRAPPQDSPVAPAIDTALLNRVGDSLIDIAVYATMALNRFKRGDADPRTLETLCRKIRSQAIDTRRLAHRLLPPAEEPDRTRDTD